MAEPLDPASSASELALRNEIVRLNKMVQALMNRAERSASVQGTDFSLFQTAILLEEQIHQRTQALEAALHENEKITRALQRATQQMEQEIQQRQRVQEALQESEERYRAATEAVVDAFVTIDEHGVIVFANPAAEGIFGYAVSEMLGQPITMLMPERLRTRHSAAFQRYLATGQKRISWQAVQFPCRHKDGREVPLEFSFGEFLQHGKRYFTGIAHDVSARLRADALREGQQRVLEMIASSEPLADVLSHLVLTIESQSEGLLGSIALLDADAVHMRHGAAPSLPADYAEGLNGVEIGPAVGSCGTAMFRGEQVIVSDIEHDPLWAAYRGAVAPFGLRACWSTPIFSHDGKVLGSFAMYYREVRSPTPDETRLMELAVRMAGIAIERKQDEAYIRHMAHHDALTGLPNRMLLEDRLRQTIAQAHRQGSMVGLLFIDLDHFKHINDSLGHHVGDRLLQSAAERMRACLREGDSVARLGGDEFVISLPGLAGSQEAAVVAEKVQAALAQPYLIGEHALEVGSSVGISLYPLDGQDAESLLRTADTAMYDAKQKGRGQYQFFTPALNEAVQQRLTLARELRQALQRSEFVLHYQPQVNLASGVIIGTEALLRWNHPQHGLLGPARFLPMLEETGLMQEVGKWVLRAACEQNLAWQAEGLPSIRVAVNLSPRQFQDGNVVRTVADTLRQTGLRPDWLELELTEGAILDHTDTAIQAMHDLKRMGVRLSLDDFGTGYSSLAYLQRFPVDRLKIDQTFVRDVACNANSANIVRSIVGLAERLGLAVIAEGVETPAQLNYLQKQGCGEIQGYLFSPPIPAAQLADQLRAGQRLAATPQHSSAAYTLLLVDDEEHTRTAIQRLLGSEGLEVLTAVSADEAFTVLAQREVGVVISDLRMPGSNGLEFLCEVKGLYPNIIRILLTGYLEVPSMLQAINRGALYKILTKPWEDEQLIDSVREAFRWHKALVDKESEAKAARQPHAA